MNRRKFVSGAFGAATVAGVGVVVSKDVVSGQTLKKTYVDSH